MANQYQAWDKLETTKNLIRKKAKKKRLSIALRVNSSGKSKKKKTIIKYFYITIPNYIGTWLSKTSRFIFNSL